MLSFAELATFKSFDGLGKMITYTPLTRGQTEQDYYNSNNGVHVLRAPRTQRALTAREIEAQEAAKAKRAELAAKRAAPRSEVPRETVTERPARTETIVAERPARPSPGTVQERTVNPPPSRTPLPGTEVKQKAEGSLEGGVATKKFVPRPSATNVALGASDKNTILQNQGRYAQDASLFEY